MSTTPEHEMNPLGGPHRLLVRRTFSTPSAAVGATIIAVLVVVAVLAPVLAPADPFAISGPALSGPSPAHPMGTDSIGRDVLSGVIVGTRTSLTLAGLVGLIVFVLGVGIGTVSGFRGGWVDDVLMRLTEALQVLPRFFLALAVIGFFGPGLDRLVLVLGVTSWPVLARAVRSQTQSIRAREFVEAARMQGASGARVIVREIWPNVLPTALTLMGLLVAEVLLIEASLGFLGLSDPNAMSWGFLASEAQRFLRTAWWLVLFPGLAILTAVLGFNLVGDSLGEAVQGRSGVRRRVTARRTRSEPRLRAARPPEGPAP